MEMKKIKSEKGFSGMDILIAIGIISLFTGIIVTLSYSIYLAASSTKRASDANSYILSIFENIDKLNYDDVTNDKLIEDFNRNNEDSINVKAVEEEEVAADISYLVTINVEELKELDEYDYEYDLIKRITVTVEYKLGRADKSLEMTTIKSREILITPNRPDIEQLVKDIKQNNEENNEENIDKDRILPIKYIGDFIVVTSQNDPNWYNYDNGNWAMALVINKSENVLEYLQENNIKSGYRVLRDELDEDPLSGDIYVWIPAYAYQWNDEEGNSDIQFIYGKRERSSNKYVERDGTLEEETLEDGTLEDGTLEDGTLEEETLEYGKLKELDDDWKLDDDFKSGTTGRWKKNIEDDLEDNDSENFDKVLQNSKYMRKNI